MVRQLTRIEAMAVCAHARKVGEVQTVALTSLAAMLTIAVAMVRLLTRTIPMAAPVHATKAGAVKMDVALTFPALPRMIAAAMAQLRT